MSATLMTAARATAPRLVGDSGTFRAELTLEREDGAIREYRLRLTSPAPAAAPKLSIRWTEPSTNVKGVWTSGALYEKRLRADWEEADVESRLSVNAPVVSLFGHRDENRLTFAFSDAVNTTRLAAPVREEDNLIYCQIDLFGDRVAPLSEYTALLRIDRTATTYDRTLQDVGRWWDDQLRGELPAIPAAARAAVYSTWYAYHQEMTPDDLLAECRIARDLGYRTIIVDDGWQTLDNQRGYDYTGDWEAERFTEMRAFVDAVHELGMQAMIWYSVPFCGPKSRAYQRFRGKFLTENHRWAPVFDPRYPEVRAHLVGRYASALRDWKLDGFKLDFIDDFKVYPETPSGKADGRDFADVNAAVRQLITEIRDALTAIRPDVLIEFRQQYIGPELRRLGNMFRAFDCPHDSATNRLRTTDVRLLAGQSVVHSDMFTWHPEETDEVAALQLNNVLFSVPQVSVRLREQSAGKLAMLRFWTGYYNDNLAQLTGGDFRAYSPLENYPLLESVGPEKSIFGLFGRAVVGVAAGTRRWEVINGRMETAVLLRLVEDVAGTVRVFDCRGALVEELRVDLPAGVHALEVPASGLLVFVG
ncbi:MAG: glycoside hydrolase family 36 protein [Bacteroidota bacterium]